MERPDEVSPLPRGAIDKNLTQDGSVNTSHSSPPPSPPEASIPDSSLEASPDGSRGSVCASCIRKTIHITKLAGELALARAELRRTQRRVDGEGDDNDDISPHSAKAKDELGEFPVLPPAFPLRVSFEERCPSVSLLPSPHQGAAVAKQKASKGGVVLRNMRRKISHNVDVSPTPSVATEAESKGSPDAQARRMANPSSPTSTSSPLLKPTPSAVATLSPAPSSSSSSDSAVYTSSSSKEDIEENPPPLFPQPSKVKQRSPPKDTIKLLCLPGPSRNRIPKAPRQLSQEAASSTVPSVVYSSVSQIPVSTYSDQQAIAESRARLAKMTGKEDVEEQAKCLLMEEDSSFRSLITVEPECWTNAMFWCLRMPGPRTL